MSRPPDIADIAQRAIGLLRAAVCLLAFWAVLIFGGGILQEILTK